MVEESCPLQCIEVIKKKKTGLGVLHPIPGHVPSGLKMLPPLSTAWHWGLALYHLIL